MGAEQGKLLPLEEYKHQATDIEGTEKAKISKYSPDGKPVACEENVRTLYKALMKGAEISGLDGDCIGWKPKADTGYQWMSFDSVLSKAKHIGSGLIVLGYGPENSTHIGIYSQNRPEYFVAEQACYMYSMVIVPLYDTLGVDACNHIINQAELNVVLCDKDVKVSNLLSRMEYTPALKNIVVMETISEDNRTLAEKLGVQILQFTELETYGQGAVKEPKPCQPEDNAVICYTSGTTGVPKGAILTHEGILSSAQAILHLLKISNIEMCKTDTLISYLPLAHVYERMLEACVYQTGGRIGFFQGDVRKLLDDIQELKPTIFPAVPRLLNRLYDKTMASVNTSSIKAKMFSMALASKENDIKNGIIKKDTLWDNVVFSKVQQTLGGCVRLITTGSAPLSPKVLMFLRCVTGCPVVEGYGQTECSGLCSAQIPGDPATGNVGPPVRCNYIKLVDIPDMDYFAKDDKGEVCVKGPNVFKGYLKDPEKTKEAIDSDGWLHTGDVGQWMANGCLKLIDRKKNIFKLAQGEYVAPEKVENLYVTSKLVAQAYVHGDSLKSSVVAVIIPDQEVLPGYAKEKLGLEGDIESLCKQEAVKEVIMTKLQSIAKTAKLASFEQAKAIYLHPEMFSVENGLLTPTFKARRTELKVFFKTQIDEMYKDLP